MSTADSQLLVTASSISEDIYNKYINKNADDNKKLMAGRAAVIGVSIIAVIIAFDPNSSVFGLVSNAWAGLGAAFGPVVLLSVFWRRMNRFGAMAGMVSGAAGVIIWNTLEKTFPNVEIFQLYELLPAFIISVICIYVFSVLTEAPSKNVLDTFDEVRGLE